MSDQPSAPPQAGAADFLVHLEDGVALPFRQVEVAASDLPAVEIRHGNSPVFYPIKMPGLGRVGNVILREGVFARSAQLTNLRQRIAEGDRTPRTIAIDLLDEAGVRKATWTLNNAWPTQLTAGGDAPNGGAGVATLELAFERLAIVVPPEG